MKITVEVPAGYEGVEEIQSHLCALRARHGSENVELVVIQPAPGDPRYEDPEMEDLHGRSVIHDLPG